METLKEQLEEIKEQIAEQPEQISAESVSVSPNYKGKHPVSKEELEKRKEQIKKMNQNINNKHNRIYECKDPAVNPGHYKSKNGLEVIDCIEAFTEDLTGIEAVCVANILKYICRYKKKNGLQDVLKSRWYCEKLIKHLEEQDKNK